ncbi:MAG TPA: hypothetical protein VK843_21740 [Planctomycetota bacterium]|nr:hypothetical protein [Planctomycetota bacterium]
MTMTRGEIPLPVRHPSLPGDQRCEAAREELAALLEQGKTLGEAPELRAHLQGCEDCNQVYRDSLLADARLRRTMVDAEDRADEASDGEESPRRAVLSPIAIARAGFASTGRGKATWVVALAVVLYAAIRLTPEPSGTARAQLQSLAGMVFSTGEPLAVGAPQRELQRGDWVRTPEDGRARLLFGESEVLLAPSTQVQIEEPSTRRLRLESGSLEVNGPLWVTSSFGIVQIEDGQAKLTIGEKGMFVESGQGHLRAIDSLGLHELDTGESAQLAFAK